MLILRNKGGGIVLISVSFNKDVPSQSLLWVENSPSQELNNESSTITQQRHNKMNGGVQL